MNFEVITTVISILQRTRQKKSLTTNVDFHDLARDGSVAVSDHAFVHTFVILHHAADLQLFPWKQKGKISKVKSELNGSGTSGAGFLESLLANGCVKGRECNSCKQSSTAWKSLDLCFARVLFVESPTELRLQSTAIQMLNYQTRNSFWSNYIFILSFP